MFFVAAHTHTNLQPATPPACNTVAIATAQAHPWMWVQHLVPSMNKRFVCMWALLYRGSYLLSPTIAVWSHSASVFMLLSLCAVCIYICVCVFSTYWPWGFVVEPPGHWADWLSCSTENSRCPAAHCCTAAASSEESARHCNDISNWNIYYCANNIKIGVRNTLNVMIHIFDF